LSQIFYLIRNPGPLVKYVRYTVYTYQNGQLANVTWSDGSVSTVIYACQPLNNNTYYRWNDVINIANFRTATASNTMQSITFITPVVIKGKYKVWFMYPRGQTNGAQFYIYDVALQNVLPNMQTIYGNTTDSGPVLESKGFKRYNESPVASGSASYISNLSFYCGIVGIATTDHHKFTITAVGTGGTANPEYMDMMQLYLPMQTRKRQDT
jgi:hypothetical protein